MRNIFNIILKFDIKTTPLYRSNLTLYELLKKGVDNNATGKNNYCMERSDPLTVFSGLANALNIWLNGIIFISSSNSYSNSIISLYTTYIN